MSRNIRHAIAASMSAITIFSIGEAAARNAAQGNEAMRASLERIEWNIPAQSLTDALIAWSARSNYVVLIEDDIAAGLLTPPIKGNYTSLDALDLLLKEQGLVYKVRGDDTLVIMARLQSASMSVGDPEARAGEPDAPQLLDADGSAEPSREPRAPTEAKKSDDEIIVTGTRIRGAPPAAALRTVTRAEIDASGQSQIGDILRNIPQNSPGGSNRGVQPTPIGDAAANQSNATTINLRGLGPDATLTLVNGHRLATDSHWGGPDVSVIPVAAIERIEIVTDGASALYGSDAVAGVANFILRRDYDGAEASARVGGATRGGGFEQTYNLMAGGGWGSGNALGGVEYQKQRAIGVSERDFTSTALPGNLLLPPQERGSAFVAGRQDLGGALRLEFTGLYTDRSADYASEVGLPGLPFTLKSNTAVDVASHLLAPRLAIELSDEWGLTIEGVNSRSDNRSTITTSFGSKLEDNILNKTKSIELNLQGVVLALPTGPVRLAAGGGFRKEAQIYETSAGPLDRDAERRIGYAYAETLIPLIGPSDERFGLNEFDLSAALRFEDYSDFGSTVNPRIGLRLSPSADLVLRATWGKSFKAPLFRQLHTPALAALFPAVVLGAPGPGAGIVVSGGNAELGPERSTSWTAGFDWSPEAAPGLLLSATFFDVDYTDRIVLPFSSLGMAFSDSDLAPFVSLNPSAGEQAAVISGAAGFFNNTGAPYDPANVVGIAFASFVNASAQKFKGVDLSLSYSFKLLNGRVDLFSDASFLDFTQRTLPSQEFTERSGRIFYPASWRARGGATYETGRLAATAALNFVGGSDDNFSSPAARVSSWTTLDLNFRYRLPDWSRRIDGLEASLSISNALDAAPPFAAGGGVATPGIFFDSANASGTGRFIAATLRQTF